MRSRSPVDELSRAGDLDARWDLLLFFECLKARMNGEEKKELLSYFFEDLPSFRRRSRLDERRERFLSRSVLDRCEEARCAGEALDEEDELDERFLIRNQIDYSFVWQRKTQDEEREKHRSNEMHCRMREIREDLHRIEDLEK